MSDVMSTTSSESLMINVSSLDDEPRPLLTRLLLPRPLGDEPRPLLSSEQEPEAWSVTVDLKTLKKMTAKNIKRQDHIWGQSLSLSLT